MPLKSYFLTNKTRMNMISFVRMFRLGTRLAPVTLLFATHLFGGQSLVLAGNPLITVADPGYPHNQSWRVEFQIHDWTLPATGAPPIVSLAGVGFAAYLGAEGRIRLESLGDSVVEQAPCLVNLAGMRNALVRFQRNASTMKITCEIWSYDSTGYNTQTESIRTLGNLSFGGGGFGGGANAALAYLRVFTTLLPLGGRPPVTADAGDWTDLRF